MNEKRVKCPECHEGKITRRVPKGAVAFQNNPEDWTTETKTCWRCKGDGVGRPLGAGVTSGGAADAADSPKANDLLLRVFSLIKKSHFSDHKMMRVYVTPLEFDRTLGNDIANFVQAKFPERYHAERRKDKDEKAAEREFVEKLRKQY